MYGFFNFVIYYYLVFNYVMSNCYNGQYFFYSLLLFQFYFYFGNGFVLNYCCVFEVYWVDENYILYLYCNLGYFNYYYNFGSNYNNYDKYDRKVLIVGGLWNC